MASDGSVVTITASNVDAAVPLAQPVSEGAWGTYRVAKLELSQEESSRLGRLFKGGGGISVTVDPSPVDGGALLWATQVRFPKKIDIEREFARTELEWPVWWAVPDMTHLIEKVRILEFVGFAWPELALPWFVRLHAAATGADALAPVVVTQTVTAPMRAEHEEINDLDDLIDEVQESTLSDELKSIAYAEWQARAAEQSP